MRFNSLALVLLGYVVTPVLSQETWSKGYPAPAPAPVPAPTPTGVAVVPSQLPWGKTKECTNGSGCNMRVGLQCRYTDPATGDRKNCINLDKPKEPFLRLTAAECERLGSAPATISYEYCNLNEQTFIPDPNHHMIQFREGQNISPQWLWYDQLGSEKCQLFRKNDVIDLCKESRVMDIAAQGNLQNGDFCRCYLFRDSVIEILSAPTCDVSKVIITELANPSGSIFASSFIELFFGDECKNKLITQDLIVKSSRGGTSTISLKGETVPDDGFFIICLQGFDQVSDYSGKACDLVESTFDSPAYLNGQETVSVGIDNSDIFNIPFDVIDIYGYGNPGNTQQVFTGGRAVRKLEADLPSSLWMPSMWVIEKPATAAVCDPREWLRVITLPPVTLLLTELVDSDVDGEAVPRMVEIYAPNDAGADLTMYDIKLVIFPESDLEPNWDTAVDIDSIGSDGFVVVCNDIWGERLNLPCSIQSAFNGPGNSDGNDQIAIVNGYEDNYVIMDIFGVIGKSGPGNPHYFADSRAVRRLTATIPRDSWRQYEWVIYTSDGDDSDPFVWTGPPLLHPSASPSTSSPSTSPVADKMDCNLIITELADPVGNSVLAFVEIFASCPGEVIGGGFEVAVTGSAPISLDGITVPSDGFIIICPLQQVFPTVYSGKSCDIQVPTLALGDYPVYIRQGKDVVDNFAFYGGEFELFPTYNFGGGRAVRNTLATASPLFDPLEWSIIPGQGSDTAGPGDMDPREWKDEPLELFFTEFCDPVDAESNGFIELYSPNKRGYLILEDLHLLKFSGTSTLPTSQISLQGYTIDENGFLVLCKPNNAWGDQCTTEVSTFLSSFGTDHFVLCSCVESSSCYIDTYGRPGTNGINADHSFTDGRGARKLEQIPTPSAFFIIDHWSVTPGAGNGEVETAECDPGVWVEPPVKSLSSSPSSSPSNPPNGGSPSKGSPSNGKSKKRGRHRALRSEKK